MLRRAGNHAGIRLKAEVLLAAGLLCDGVTGDATRMPTRTAPRNVYDPRVRAVIRATGNPDLLPELNIFRSTAAGSSLPRAPRSRNARSQRPRCSLQ
jgi:hypothetical protein